MRNQPFNPPLNRAEQALARRLYPRAGFWYNNPGQHYHPDIHPHQYQRQLAEDAAWLQQFDAAQQPPGDGPPLYAPPAGPPPGYNEIVEPGPGQPHPHRAQGKMYDIFILSTIAHTELAATHIYVSVPLNTGVVGGIVSRTEIRLAIDIPFLDAYSRLCARMDLDPLTSQLGYKYHDDRRRDEPHQLSNADQWQTAINHGIDLMRRARTRRVVLEITNLVRSYH